MQADLDPLFDFEIHHHTGAPEQHDSRDNEKSVCVILERYGHVHAEHRREQCEREHNDRKNREGFDDVIRPKVDEGFIRFVKRFDFVALEFQLIPYFLGMLNKLAEICIELIQGEKGRRDIQQSGHDRFMRLHGLPKIHNIELDAENVID